MTYPGLPRPRITDHLTRENSRDHHADGTEFHIGRIDMVANTGTCLDTPSHRYPDDQDISGTGSLILGAAGLLQGRRTTTHWVALEELRDHGATPVTERVLINGNVVTAGIDMRLTLAAKLRGRLLAQMLQLALEYDPAPPSTPAHHSRSPSLPRAVSSAHQHDATGRWRNQQGAVSVVTPTDDCHSPSHPVGIVVIDIAVG